MFLRLEGFLFILYSLKLCKGKSSIKIISPKQSLENEVLYDRQVALYHAVHLHANSTYEVRVSYPAVVPTDFTIQVIPPTESFSRKSRSLLDIEKAVFATTEITEGYTIEITAHRTGYPWNQERLTDPVVYNLALDTLHGGLSSSSWKMVGYSFFILTVTFTCIVPMVHRYIVSRITKNEHTS